MNLPRRQSIPARLAEDIPSRLEALSTPRKADVHDPRNAIFSPLIDDFLVFGRLLVGRLRVERRVLRLRRRRHVHRLAVLGLALALVLLRADRAGGRVRRIRFGCERLQLLAQNGQELLKRRMHFSKVTLEF